MEGAGAEGKKEAVSQEEEGMCERDEARGGVRTREGGAVQPGG